MFDWIKGLIISRRREFGLAGLYILTMVIQTIWFAKFQVKIDVTVGMFIFRQLCWAISLVLTLCYINSDNRVSKNVKIASRFFLIIPIIIYTSIPYIEFIDMQDPLVDDIENINFTAFIQSAEDFYNATVDTATFVIAASSGVILGGIWSHPPQKDKLIKFGAGFKMIHIIIAQLLAIISPYFPFIFTIWHLATLIGKKYVSIALRIIIVMTFLVITMSTEYSEYIIMGAVVVYRPVLIQSINAIPIGWFVAYVIKSTKDNSDNNMYEKQSNIESEIFLNDRGIELV